MTTVLVVDDDARARGILRRRLETAGYVVTEAWGGETTQERLRQAQLDLVLVDLVLPGTGGGEQIIANLERKHPNVRIVAMSGAPERLVEVAARHPRLHLLPKPFTTEQLLDAVAGALAEPQPKHGFRARLGRLLEFLKPSA